MGYYIDLEKISIIDYCEKLKSSYLPPSRTILKDNLDDRFSVFKSLGINNVKELLAALKNKKKFTELSRIERLPESYLTILLRELNSLLPKPNKLTDFKEIDNATVDKLAKIGIKNTEQLYNKVLTKDARTNLSKGLSISDTEMLQLTKLCDLSRIKWVGATFAQMLYALGIDTAEKASKADAIDLHSKINTLSKDNNIYKGHIGLNDIRIFIEAAKEVSFDIEY